MTLTLRAGEFLAGGDVLERTRHKELAKRFNVGGWTLVFDSELLGEIELSREERLALRDALVTAMREQGEDVIRARERHELLRKLGPLYVVKGGAAPQD